MNLVLSQILRLEAIVRRMVREVNSYRGEDEFFQRMAELRFAANDAICILFGYVSQPDRHFIEEGSRFRFCHSVEMIRDAVSDFQNRWSFSEIRKNQIKYIDDSRKSAEELYNLLNELKDELVCDALQDRAERQQVAVPRRLC